MPNPDDTTREQIAERMRAYTTDTARHFVPGSDLEPRYLAIAAYVPERRRILDVGCNSGAMGVRLAYERGAEMWGVEPNPALATIALSMGVYRFIWPAMFEECADDIPPAWFGVVLACDPLDYCADPDALMVAMMSKLVPGGWMVGDAVHAAGWWGDTDRHAELMRSWTQERLGVFLSKYLANVEIVPAYARRELKTPQWLIWKGKRA